jgi:hypothetical protein
MNEIKQNRRGGGDDAAVAAAEQQMLSSSARLSLEALYEDHLLAVLERLHGKELLKRSLAHLLSEPGGIPPHKLSEMLSVGASKEQQVMIPGSSYSRKWRRAFIHRNAQRQLTMRNHKNNRL